MISMSITAREVKNKKDRSGIPTYQSGIVYDVNIKYKCEDGSFKTYGKRGFYSKSDAITHQSEMRVKLQDAYYQKGYLKYHQATLETYLMDWLEDYAFRYVAANTYRSYRSNITKHIVPAIGNSKLRNITSTMIDDVCANMFDNGYANATVRYVYRTLSVALEHAKKHKYIEGNPVRDTFTKFKDVRNIPKPYDITEMKLLLESTNDSQWKFIIVLAGLYGLRRGEVFGMKINNINLEKREFQVSEQLSSSTEFKRFGEYTVIPKTKSSIRTLPITEYTLPYFQERVNKYMENRKEFDEGYKKLGIIMCHSNGEPYSAAHVSERFNLILDKIEMRHIRFHDLRRSAATNMHELTGDFYTVGQILGHSLKGIGLSLGIATNMTDITAKYIDVHLNRKMMILEMYHKALHPLETIYDIR